MKDFRIYIMTSILFFCGLSKSNAQQTIWGSIIHDDIEREYILYIPNIYNPQNATPLVFNFHGYGSNANEQMNYGNFKPIADSAGFIIIHPLGTVDNIGNNHWNVGFETSTIDDIGFTNALIDSILQEYNIDESRIYTTGMSNGGFLSYLLACNLSHKFAAIASVTGSMVTGQIANCNCENPTPIMEIHGTADITVPYDGNFMFHSIEEIINYWVGFNNCNSTPIVTEMPDLNPNDGSTVTHYLYDNGNEGSTVEHFKVINGTHTWPGSNFDLGGTNYDIDASAEIWRFFSKYDIDGLINPTSTIQKPEIISSIKTYPNPFSESIIIETSLSNEYQILSACGQIVFSGTTQSGSSQIHLGHLDNGVYFIKIDNQFSRIIKN